MTPMVLLQLVGPAVGLHVAEIMHNAFPDRFGVSENMKRFVEAGKTAVWQWDAQGNQTLDPEVAALWQAGSSPSTSSELLDPHVGRVGRRDPADASTRAWWPRRRTSTCA